MQDSATDSSSALSQPEIARVSAADITRPELFRAWRLVIALALTAMASFTDRFVLNVLVAPVQGDLGLTDAQFGLLIGPAFALATVIAALPCGRAADVFPRKPILLGALILWSLGSFGCAFATTFGMFAVARVFVGLGEAAIVPLGYSLIGDLLPPHHRGRALSVVTAGVMLGSSAGYILGGALLDIASSGAWRNWPLLGTLAPWRAVIVAVTLPNVLLAGFIAFLPEPERGRWETAKTSTRWPVVRDALRADAPVLALLYLTPSLVAVADYALYSWGPAMAMRRFNLGAAEAGTLVGSLALLATITATLCAGALGDRLIARGRAHALPLLGALASLLLVVVAVALTTHHRVFFFGAFNAGGFATIAAETIAIIILQNRLSSATRGVGTALMSLLVSTLGLGLGPLLPPTLAPLFGTDPSTIVPGVCITSGLAGALALILFLRLGTQLRSEFASTPPPSRSIATR
ncbi:MAG TPA: MFS transporter [Polyangium sp.]|nr:MFS transporter [Polyangium sp.]